jgi:hypothetical protein
MIAFFKQLNITRHSQMNRLPRVSIVATRDPWLGSQAHPSIDVVCSS